MENETGYRKYLPAALWIAVFASIYYTYSVYILPNSAGITLNGKIVAAQVKQIASLLFGVFGGIALCEIFFYQIFFREPLNRPARIFTRLVQYAIGALALALVLYFFDMTDLLRLGDGALAQVARAPVAFLDGLGKSLLKAEFANKANASTYAASIVAFVFVVLFAVIQLTSKPRSHPYGLAYLLVLPAFLGVLFLIIYPFLFEIKLAFSNAALGTQVTKNAQYGLSYGWNNLVLLFTGPVAKDAYFFDVFLRTVLWTVINVSFHVAGGMGLAILLNRPLKFKGLYRTLLIVPWAIPTTIVAMALRNEFDVKYGLFNILLGNLNRWLVEVSHNTTNLFFIGTMFQKLAETIGPVSWKQDPFWAFVSILISNIWLGIPFMSVIILGGLQSISQEYYEAAEMDGATKWQQFRNITLPLLRPVLTPAVILGVVWTFNKFDVIYLITQGGPQEKTDILVSSMYKAAFSFYRYGFTAMFALVIFFLLFLFTLFYLKVSDGLKAATE